MSLADTRREYKPAVRTSGLWNEIEPYLLNLMDEQGEVSVNQPGSEPTGHSIAGNYKSPDDLELPAATTSALSDKPPFSSSLPPTVEDNLDGGYQREVAVAIREDIEDIKARYIVGKTVGRDLFDSDGICIARQGDRITHQLVRVVEEAGLLVELIENMTFASFED